MRTKWYFPALILLLLISRFDASAQEESQIQIEFKLTDEVNKTSRTYKLSGVNYAVSNPYYMQDESKLINEGSCMVSMDLAQDADEFLMKWIGGNIKNASGLITMVILNSVKKPRNIVFTGGQVAASSESFYLTTGGNTSQQISMYVKTLSVDGTTIFSQPKNNNR